MKIYFPKKPVGESSLWTWRRAIWDLLWGGQFPIRGDGIVNVEWTQGFYRISSRPAPSASNGLAFKVPAEIDPTKATPANLICYCSGGNTLVTDPLTDLVSGTVTPAVAGWYRSVKAIPAQVTAAGVTKYNVPVFPPPGSGGVPGGSPLKGDMDGGAAGVQVYWQPISNITCC